MLTRKPRKGAQLEHIKNWGDVVNGNSEPVWQPLGTVLRCEGNICWYMPPDKDEAACFIWRFPSDGTLNKATRIKEKAWDSTSTSS